MSAVDKRQSQSFSLSDSEYDDMVERAKDHGFQNVSQYVRALYEADLKLGLELRRENREWVLRLPEEMSEIEWELEQRKQEAEYDFPKPQNAELNEPPSADQLLEDRKQEKKGKQGRKRKSD